jgi:hypothetical protein
LALDPVLNSDVMLERADPLADEAGQLDRVRDRRGRLASVESLRLVLAVFEILRKICVLDSKQWENMQKIINDDCCSFFEGLSDFKIKNTY